MRGPLPAALGVLLMAACAAPVARAPAGSAASAPERAVPSTDDPKALLAAVRAAYSQGDYAGGLALVKRLVEVSPDKVTAYDRIGSTYFALGRGVEALGMWETALALERDPERKAELAASVALARRSLGLPEPAPAEPPAVSSAAAVEAAPPRPHPRKRDPEGARRLYQEGVEKYADDEFMAATALFMKALELDPDNEPARKALERLRLKPDAPTAPPEEP